MNKKVEELVEWVAGEILQAQIDEDRGGRVSSHLLARQILSHPDLALITECELCEGTGYLPNDDTGEPNPPVGGIRCPVCHETGIIPIPLAEALEEKNV